MLRGEDLLDAIAERVEERLARSKRWQSQHGSPLGPRTHRAAVKRRIERGEGGAEIVKGRFLLTQQALAQELAQHTDEYRAARKRPDDGAHHRTAGERRPPRRARDQSPELDALQRELTGGLRTLREVR